MCENDFDREMALTRPVPGPLPRDLGSRGGPRCSCVVILLHNFLELR
jgi:hypothetical protein